MPGYPRQLLIYGKLTGINNQAFTPLFSSASQNCLLSLIDRRLRRLYIPHLDVPSLERKTILIIFISNYCSLIYNFSNSSNSAKLLQIHSTFDSSPAHCFEQNCQYFNSFRQTTMYTSSSNTNNFYFSFPEVYRLKLKSVTVYLSIINITTDYGA